MKSERRKYVNEFRYHEEIGNLSWSLISVILSLLIYVCEMENTGINLPCSLIGFAVCLNACAYTASGEINGNRRWLRLSIIFFEIISVICLLGYAFQNSWCIYTIVAAVVVNFGQLCGMKIANEA